MSEKEEGEDSEELRLKAKKDGKDKAYNAFMGLLQGIGEGVELFK